MATEFQLPELGENIASATVVEVLVAAGDTIARDQAVVSLETDKAEFEVPSPFAGRVVDVLVREGEEVKVGQVILRVEEAGAGDERAAGGDGTSGKAPAKAAARAAEAAEPEGEAAQGRAAAAPERSKRSEASAKPAAAKRARAEAAEQEDAGEDASEVEDAEASEGAGKGEPQPARATSEPNADRRAQERAPKPAATGPVPAAPSVRRLARELGVEIAEVEGSGSGGRISERDVQRHARRLLSRASKPAAKAAEPEQSHGEEPRGVEHDAWGVIERAPMSKVRQRISVQMTQGWSTIPQVTHHDKADITELERLRRHYAKRVEAGGGKLTMTAILMKVLGSALRKFPRFNASIDVETSTILYKRYVHIAVAVDTERGLLAPVVRDCDEKNIVEIAAELADLAKRARGRAITPEMLQGATFTISNLGGIGGTAFSPIVNPPQVALLGVARAAMEPRFKDGATFEPRLMLPLSLSYDHRLIDGADAARFVRWVCEALEQPFLINLEGA